MFERYCGIDYSGAGTPENRLSGLRVCLGTRTSAARPVSPSTSSELRKRNWSRRELSVWLIRQLAKPDPILVGIDHAFGFPLSYWKRARLRNWDHFLRDFQSHWPTDRPGSRVDDFRDETQQRAGDSREMRITDRWTNGPKSVFHFDVQGSVAKSTHAGLPFLKRLRDQLQGQVHFWPFDGWEVPEGQSAVVEVFPSLVRNRYDRGDRTVDEQDAYAIARWMRDMDRCGHLGRYFDPPLSPVQKHRARREGWIFGVV